MYSLVQNDEFALRCPSNHLHSARPRIYLGGPDMKHTSFTICDSRWNVFDETNSWIFGAPLNFAHPSPQAYWIWGVPRGSMQIRTLRNELLTWTLIQRSSDSTSYPPPHQGDKKSEFMKALSSITSLLALLPGSQLSQTLALTADLIGQLGLRSCDHLEKRVFLQLVLHRAMLDSPVS